MSVPKIGQMAPAFSLKDQDGNSVSLRDFKDSKNVVLYFYPKAMTPGCTVQACGVRDNKNHLPLRILLFWGFLPIPLIA